MAKAFENTKVCERQGRKRGGRIGIRNGPPALPSIRLIRTFFSAKKGLSLEGTGLSHEQN
jgi:hypothetical protein